MNARTWAAGLLAVGGLFLGGAAVRADDTIKLGLPGNDDAPAVSLGKLSPEAETIDARFSGGRGGHFGGHFGGYGRGFYGYGRGFYGYGRGFYGYGRGFYGYGYGLGYARYYYPRYGYYNSYYYPSGSYYYSDPCYYPISQPGIQVSASADVLNVPYTPNTLQTPVPDGRTFPYDGGPRPSVPMPNADPSPTRIPVPATVPAPTVPLDGRAVSLPAPTPAKFAYPAYGELPRTTSFAQDRVLPVKK